MRHKFLGPIFAIIAAPTFAGDALGLPDAWANSHYGTCYSSITAGMVDVYGSDYASDENITLEKTAYGIDNLLTSSDHTSGTNASRTIFEKKENDRWCIVLTSPPVASLIPVMKKGATTKPAQWMTNTQAPPGYAETRVTYIWSKQRNIYYPSECYLISGGNKKKLNCTDAYQQ